MSENKTQKTTASVAAYIDAIVNPQQRADAKAVDAMMRAATGEEPAMWGTSMVGYGSYTYVYASGRSGDWPLVGFAARKSALTLYIMAGFDRYDALMQALGKHKVGKSCLYISKLADIDLAILRELIGASVKHMRGKRPEECQAAPAP